MIGQGVACGAARPAESADIGGYGYLWWTSASASGARARDAMLSRPAFWADGHLGQYAVVVPSLDLVVVSLVDARLTSKRIGQTKMETRVTLIEAAHAGQSSDDTPPA